MADSNQKILPLIPIRNIVVFPAMIVPLYVGRQSSLAALEQAASSETKQIILSTQINAEVKEPGPADLYQTGMMVKIIQLLRLPDGTVKVLVEGEQRVKIINFAGREPYFLVEYEVLGDLLEVNKELAKKVKQVTEKFDDFVKINKKIPAETLLSIVSTDDPALLSDTVVTYLTLTVAEKQQLLETQDVASRLNQLTQYLIREIGLLDVEKKMHGKVQDQIEKIQREYYLKEKLKAIQKELGEENSNVTEEDEYKQKIAAAGLPEFVQKKAQRELNRLVKLQSISAEANVIRTYLDWLIELPWQEETTSTLELKKVKALLDQEHYGLADVKDRILEYLAVFQNTQKSSGSIILLAGPPGVGKTSIAQSIAKAMNRKFYRISLGGLRDEAELRGHRRTYVGALPGKIIQALCKVQSRNPLILLDEIDKLAKDYRGDPAAVLMEILDPEQNKNFTDSYLETAFDLSQVLFLATANIVHEIPKTLLDRLEVIKLSGYSEEEKLVISRDFLVPKILKLHGLPPQELEFTEEGLRLIINEYTREAGLRDLERALARICRKYVRNKLENQKNYPKISRHNMHHYLGLPKYKQEKVAGREVVGVAQGLAWTETGGDVISVEASVLPGSGALILTGKMGEVMQESAKAALTYIRSKYLELGLKKDFYKNHDLHIHIPEGAIPKDGPSAGICIATAIASAFSGLPVRKNLAMTGEITLRGHVLKIGGLREKVLAALRAGIGSVLIPAENQPELSELAGKIKKKLKFVPVSSMDEVLFFAIKGYQKKDKKLELPADYLAAEEQTDSKTDNSSEIF